MSLTKRIIPCLDVKNGKVVKGIKFGSLRYAGDPIKLAKRYSNEGADELVFLDITASQEHRPIMLEVARRAAEGLNIPFTIGGGLRTLEDIGRVLREGADKVSINTSAVNDPSLIKKATRKFGSQAVVVAIDAQQSGNNSWEVLIYSGQKKTGLDALKWAKEAEELGAGEILLTSKDRDGTKLGFDLKLTRTIAGAVNIPVVASGGAGTLDHFYNVFRYTKASAALAASIFHFREIEIKDLKLYLRRRGMNVRL